MPFFILSLHFLVIALHVLVLSRRAAAPKALRRAAVPLAWTRCANKSRRGILYRKYSMGSKSETLQRAVFIFDCKCGLRGSLDAIYLRKGPIGSFDAFLYSVAAFPCHRTACPGSFAPSSGTKSTALTPPGLPPLAFLDPCTCMVLSLFKLRMCGWGPYTRKASVWEACCWHSGVISMS